MKLPILVKDGRLYSSLEPLPEYKDYSWDTHNDVDNGYWIESFGIFNNVEGNHIADSGADIEQFLMTKQLNPGER